MSRARLFVYITAIGLGLWMVAAPLASLSVSKPNRKPAKSDKSIAILYTSQVYGQVRSCNCTKFRYGGYGRQATLMQQLSEKNPDLVLVDCGDALGGDTSKQGQLKSSLTTKIMSNIGYNAWVPGEMEIAADLHNLNEQCRELKVPLTCANVFDSTTGKRVCSSHVSFKTANGARVTVIGLLGKNLVANDVLRNTNVKIGDPADLLSKLAPTVRKTTDVLLVAAHMTIADAQAIAKLGIGDVVICSHIEKDLLMPAKDQNEVDAPYSNDQTGVFLKSMTRTNWSVGRLDMKLSQSGKWQAQSNKLLYLDRAYEESPAIVKLFDEYNAEVAAFYIEQRLKMRDELDKKIRARGLDPDEMRERNKRYAGHAACKSCHEAAYDVWKSSRHSTAINTLKKTKQEYDPECVGCHTTGRDQLSGFVNMKETPELANVQCESCHGAGKAHVAKPAAGYGVTGEDNCRSCHTDELDPDFDYEVMWKKIAH
jgi:2',3'-cyclic-nucleotide 2'-phosphodiesterase (5'-nucleotidase family)